MVALSIAREGFLEVTEINLVFSRSWARSERKWSLVLASSLLLITMIQHFFAAVQRSWYQTCSGMTLKVYLLPEWKKGREKGGGGLG